MTKIHLLRRIVYFIATLLLALLIVPAVHAQDTSNQILYAVSDENGDRTIYSLNVDDGVKTQIGTIHNSDSDAGWSPDGKFIYLFDNNDSKLPSLTLIDADTHHSQPIPDPIESVFCGLPFSWSPKGEWLTYNTQSDSQPIRKIYNPTTGDFQILTNANVDNLIMHWSSDNRYLTYETQNNKLAIWDVQNQRMVALPEAISDYFPKWSPAENLIAFSSEYLTHQVIYNLSSETQQQYDADSIGDWSPDGKFLIRYSSSKGQIILLPVTDALNNKTIELDRGISPTNSEGLSPWSSNSRYLTISKHNETNDDQMTISILNVLNDSIQPTKIHLGSFDTFVWSPIGSRLALVSDTKDIERMPYFTSLWLFDANSRQSQHYDVKIPIMDSERRINWSPNGRYLTIPNESGDQLLDWDSETLNPIDTPKQAFSHPRWSPDGTKFAAESRFDIYILTPEDTTIKNVTNTPDQDETILGWRGASGGRSLSYCGEG